jgi:hypothetical protein
MNKEFLKTKKFWGWFCIISIILVIAAHISDLNKSISGIYKSVFQQFSIELQEGGKLFISPYSSTNKTIYCAAQGNWTKNGNNIILSFDNDDQYCDRVNNLNGMWRLSKCKNFDGNSNWCISKENFTLAREQ